MDRTSYNFVIFSSNQDYFRYIFNDIIKLPNVKYLDNPIYNNYGFLLHLIFKIHTSKHIDRILKLPFKKLWIHLYYKNSFRQNKPICFIFLMGWLIKENESFFKKLKKKYQGCKLVVYFEDIIASRNNKLDLALVCKFFDVAISYDRNDAKKYGYFYYPTFYSQITLPSPNLKKKTAACFIGAAKDRLELIIDVYNKLNNNNIKCYFCIGRPPIGIKTLDNIDYIKYVIPYKKYLEYISNTDCIIEILQRGSIGFTIRTWEAIVFNKKLITNNPEILNAPFYNKYQFSYFKNADDIDLDFFHTKSSIDCNASYAHKLSSMFFLDFIIDKL